MQPKARDAERPGGSKGPATREVPPELARKRLDAAVRALFDLSWDAAREAVRTGKIWTGEPPQALTDGARPVRPGQILELRVNAPRPHVAKRIAFDEQAIVHVDSHVVVVEKPPNISTIPYEGGSEDPRETLDALVREALIHRFGTRGRPPLGVVHRIDKETSGLVVFTRSVEAKKHLSQQFRDHTVERQYFAIVNGVFRGEKTMRSYLLEDRGDGVRGSARTNQREGKLAITHVRFERALEAATLVSCRLETGRTHQIRIHLSEAGHPLVGERVYVRRYEGPRAEAPRMMLHAAVLGFTHPENGNPLRFESKLPRDIETVLARLGEKR